MHEADAAPDGTMTGVTTDPARRETARLLYDEHERAEFPGRWRDEEPGGVEMVMLDADVAGVVSSWLSGGRLDAPRQSVLRSSLRDLDRVLPVLSDSEELRYCQRLRELARLVLTTGG
jgi:hypothetical protein